MTIFIRVDSGTAIGTGHVIRCLTLAAELRKKDENIIFLCKPHAGNIINFIETSGFKVVTLSEPEFEGGILEGSWIGTSLEADAAECKSIILQNAIKNTIKTDLLIIDHYSIDKTWQTILRPVCDKIFMIDDLANRAHDCDILLDQNFYLNKDERYQNIVPEHCKVFVGPAFALLRPDFFEAKKTYKFSADVKNLLVFFGGVDAAGMTLKMAEILKSYPHIHSHFIVGAANKDKDAIKAIAADRHNYTIYSHISDMASKMSECDAAIGAGGTTLWERACIGLPSLVVSIANNQTKICQDMTVAGHILYAGEAAQLNDRSLEHLTAVFLENGFLRESLYRHSLSLVPGKTDVLMKALVGDVRSVPSVTLRPARIADADTVFAWRNHPDTRRFSGNNAEINHNEHVKWFAKAVGDTNRMLLVAENAGEGVGFLRYDFLPGSTMISIFLNPEQNGKGYGTAILKAGEVYLRESGRDYAPLTAEILPGNHASEKLFTKCGYVKQKTVFNLI
jgi:UDP-2,4-diacetamido-2,4,6-trideoxy-beta-L-altropyranose hydrolase